MNWLYLDNNATTQPAPQVVQTVQELHRELWANPSSMHRFGQLVRQRVELARAAVARLIHCRDRELVFTSGGTESNNLALRGVLGRVESPKSKVTSQEEGGRILMTAKVEHSAIRAPAQDLADAGVRVVYLPVDGAGRARPADLAVALREHARPHALVLVSLQWANNETGVIQPIAELAQVVRQQRGPGGAAPVMFHVDGTQAVGKMPVDVQEAGVDLLSFAAHKFHGPKGVGALYVRRGVRLQAQMRGGPQERERRGGTENAPGIVGMGVAAELAQQFLADPQRLAELQGLRDRFERGVQTGWPATVVNSAGAPRLWNTSNLGFPRLEAEAILLGLSERGLCASAGAACSSGSLDPSPVLLAMGIAPEIAHGSIRFSLSRFTTPAEVDAAAPMVVDVVRKLAKTLPQPSPF